MSVKFPCIFAILRSALHRPWFRLCFAFFKSSNGGKDGETRFFLPACARHIWEVFFSNHDEALKWLDLGSTVLAPLFLVRKPYICNREASFFLFILDIKEGGFSFESLKSSKYLFSRNRSVELPPAVSM